MKYKQIYSLLREYNSHEKACQMISDAQNGNETARKIIGVFFQYRSALRWATKICGDL